ncbi:hypothetical protein AB0C15_15715 [Micromonospora sp. NPDC048835]|uniref:hypothetical protein n=1 Tax=Micromonospora sp. NPDC048835 TaxID=3155147 RepID=UPI0033C263CC
MRTTPSYRPAWAVTALLSLLSLVAAVLAVPTSASADAASAGCYRVGDAQYAEFRSTVKQLKAKGELSASDASALDCDPRRASERITYEISSEPVMGTLASGCKSSTNWIISFSIWGAEAGKHNQSLSWCWNNTTKKVSDWGGPCGGSTTGWGTTNGWSWDGCSQNDFIPYTLGGSYPGGIHHKTEGKFTNSVPYTPAIYLRLEIWGHYAGTCATRYNNTTRQYC